MSDLTSGPMASSSPTTARPAPAAAAPTTVGERLLAVAVALLVAKLVLSLPLLARAGGADLDFLPELSVSDALRTIGLWLVATWMVQRRWLLGWAMALTIAGIAGVTALTVRGESAAWSALSLTTSAALVLVLLAPPTIRALLRTRRGASARSTSATTTSVISSIHHPAPTDPRGTDS